MFILIYQNDDDIRAVVKPHGELLIFENLIDARKAQKVEGKNGQETSIVHLDRYDDLGIPY